LRVADESQPPVGRNGLRPPGGAGVGAASWIVEAVLYSRIRRVAVGEDIALGGSPPRKTVAAG